eukprot:TRINITY_DN19581_c0_g1_i1.p1 TRINITY_DN19581_c0_g1~~TRINITY_DN19581_c0_g1_i1.p1  ORF type:complete len:457 (+),score=161.62 TRINITY_DN19581_c0_g1_i1:55-1425(+)
MERAAAPVRLLSGEIGVEVPRDVLVMNERVQLKAEAFEKPTVRWCPYDEAGDDSRYGADCSYARVKPEAKAETAQRLAEEAARIKAIEAEEGDGSRTMKTLSPFRIVLVDPQDSRNIGSVSRLAANYGIDDVWVVSKRQLEWDEARAKRVRQRKADDVAGGEQPAASPPAKKQRMETAEAQGAAEPPPQGKKQKEKKGAHKHGGSQPGHEAFRAEDLDPRRQRHPMFNTFFWRYSEMLATPEGLPLLKGFHIVPELAAALPGVDKAIAFTGKRGVNFRNSTVDVPGIPDLAAGGRIALVFGNEAKGLSSNDTMLCSHVCTLPTSSYCTSLNLSHSVAVVVSRLFEIYNGTAPPTQGTALPAHVSAPEAEVASVFEHARAALESQGYPATKEDWGGVQRRKNKFAFRCHKHATSLLHLAQRANASTEEVKSIKHLLTLLTHRNGEGDAGDDDAGDEE